MLPEKLRHKLEQRKENNSLRELKQATSLVDFSSNDYLGFAKSEILFDKAHQLLVDEDFKINGATGSRLLSGNYKLYEDTELYLSKVHQSEKALIFNSGYTANLGFFSTVPQRNDVILYDEFIHASIRDGIQLSNAKSFKFKHNDCRDLEQLITKHNSTTVYVVTESVFSMDGDTPNLKQIVTICKKHNAHLIVDEAHALGVFGLGLVQELGLQNDVFARIITFGKALGCHGAVVLGSKELYQYLVNFSRPFIYTTGLSPHTVASINIAYHELVEQVLVQKQLRENIYYFKEIGTKLNLSFIESESAIQCLIIGGNEQTKSIATDIQQQGFDVKPILSPTVASGKERLRFCLHAYNSKDEISKVLNALAIFVLKK